ncbi:hypothetical protein CIB95_07805 [Lottiidibacillus patelloidae]|uniref:Uncharacterized protein n=1 Tax=Lottiidibacillus patelloidae TaxID=2670334 RepID=A0A263BVK3_9BACI|nr:hypothetical protein [Lottiidibacillus patelloidae]OZM57357.1 hypothetical protein CIB95_07805 [Lottiidibacillus patelloidae]
MIKTIIITFFAYGLLILLLGSLNYKKKERNLQLWVPVLLFLFATTILSIDYYIPFKLVQIVEGMFPNLLLKGYLLANILLLTLFVALKSIGRSGHFAFKKFATTSFFTSIKKRIPSNILKAIQQEKYIGYKKINYDWIINPAFTFPRKAFLYGTYVCIGINVVAILASQMGELSFLVTILPRFPILSLLLFLEFYWYLSGNNPKQQKEIYKGKDASFQYKTNYKSLYDDYKTTLNQGILLDREFSKPGGNNISFSYEKLSNNQSTQAKINQVCTKLKMKNVKINESYCEVLRDLLEDKDVLVGDVNYNDISPYLFAAIETMLLTNKKIIVITPSDKKSVTNWLRKSINDLNGLDYFWNIAAIEDVMEQNIDYDLMVTKPLDLLSDAGLAFIKKHSATTNVEAVFVLEGEKLLAEYSSPLHIFMNCLRDITEKDPQIGIFTDMYYEVEHHVRTVFNTTPAITHASIPRENSIYFIGWKKELNSKCSKQLIPTIHRNSEFESTLALPAMKHGVKKITLLEDKAITTKENLNEIFNNYKNQLSNFGIDLKSRTTILEDIIRSYEQWNLPVENENFLIINDQENNIVNSLVNNWSLGKNNSFIHIISPPYLLRDYLTANFDYFLENRKAVAPFSVRLAYTKARLAWTLIQRLSLSYLPEEKVEIYLKQANIKKLSVMEGIKELFKQTLRVDRRLLNSIDVTYKNVFNQKKMQYSTEKYYSLLLSPNQDTTRKMFSFYKIVSQEGQLLGDILGGHIFQNYLPGQIKCWQGKRFQIEKIDEEAQQIDVFFEESKDEAFYKHDQTFIITGEASHVSCDEVITKYFHFNFSSIEISFEVETHGYFSFHDEINLVGNSTTYVPLNAHRRVQTKREYDNGNILEIQVKSYGDKIKNRNKVAYTLSFLLNEVFRSLYPHTYQYISVCSPYNIFEMEQGENDHREKESTIEEKQYDRRIKQYIPKMTPYHNEVELNDDKTIKLYIFEDSPIHVGMIESIKHNWQQIVDLLDDYLYWLLKNSEESSHTYIKLGGLEVYKNFDLQATSELLSLWSSNENIKENRIAFFEQKSLENQQSDYDSLDDIFDDITMSDPENQSIETRVCDFCNEGFAAAQIIELDDGRERCIHCHNSAVDNVSEVVELYKEVRQFMVDQFGITLREDITIEVKSSKEINEESGRTFTTTENFDPRITGKAIMTASGQAKIMLENGATKIQTMATIAHELTHIWQFDNLEIDFMGIEDIEGHATWVEVYLCEMLGEKDFAYRLREEMEYRDDEYGRGYRKIVEDLKNNTEIFTPFSMFNVKVVK